jgi:hypothetical protein
MLKLVFILRGRGKNNPETSGQHKKSSIVVTLNLALSSRGKRSDERSLSTVHSHQFTVISRQFTGLPVHQFTISRLTTHHSLTTKTHYSTTPLYDYTSLPFTTHYSPLSTHHSRHLSLRVIFDRKLYREVL